MSPDELVASLTALADARDLGLRGDLRTQLGQLADRTASGDLAPADFERYFLALLTAAYLRQIGGRSPNATDLALVGRLVERQRPFVAGFAADLAAGTGTMPIATRVGLYADTVHTARQAAVVAGVAAGGRVEWVLGEDDENNCEPCQSAADGSPYVPGDLPGLPGVLCDGGPRCRCEIVPRG